MKNYSMKEYEVLKLEIATSAYWKTHRKHYIALVVAVILLGLFK